MSTLNFFSAVASAFGAVFAAIQFARLLGEKRNRDTLIAQIRAEERGRLAVARYDRIHRSKEHSAA
jgi:hypothetical protein